MQTQEKYVQPKERIASCLAFLCRALHTLSDVLNRGASWWLIIALVLMSILIGVQVFCRYILNNSLFWSEEVGRILLVQITFLGSSIAFKKGVHPSIHIFLSRLKESHQRVIQAFVFLVSAGFFFALTWYGSHFAYFIHQQITPSLGISKAIPIAVIPIASAFTCIHALSAFLRLFAHGTIKKDGEKI